MLQILIPLAIGGYFMLKNDNSKGLKGVNDISNFQDKIFYSVAIYDEDELEEETFYIKKEEAFNYANTEELEANNIRFGSIIVKELVLNDNIKDIADELGYIEDGLFDSENYDLDDFFEEIIDNELKYLESNEQSELIKDFTYEDQKQKDYKTFNDFFIEFKSKLNEKYKSYIQFKENAGFSGSSTYLFLMLDKNNNLIKSNNLIEQDKSDVVNTIINSSGEQIKQNRTRRDFIIKNNNANIVEIRIADHQRKYSAKDFTNASLSISIEGKYYDEDITENLDLENVDEEIVIDAREEDNNILNILSDIDYWLKNLQFE